MSRARGWRGQGPTSGHNQKRMNIRHGHGPLRGRNAVEKAIETRVRRAGKREIEDTLRSRSDLGDTFKERMQSPWTLVLVGIIGYSAGRAIAKSEEAEAFAKLSNSYSKISALTTGTPLKGLNGCGCDY